MSKTEEEGTKQEDTSGPPGSHIQSETDIPNDFGTEPPEEWQEDFGTEPPEEEHETCPEETAERLREIDEKIQGFVDDQLTNVETTEPRHIQGQIKHLAVKFKKQVVIQIEQCAENYREISDLVEAIERGKAEITKKENLKEIEEKRLDEIKKALDTRIDAQKTARDTIADAQASIKKAIIDSNAKIAKAMNSMRAEMMKAQLQIAIANKKARISRLLEEEKHKQEKLEAKKRGLEQKSESQKKASEFYESVSDALVDHVLKRFKNLEKVLNPEEDSPSQNVGTDLYNRWGPPLDLWEWQTISERHEETPTEEEKEPNSSES